MRLFSGYNDTEVFFKQDVNQLMHPLSLLLLFLFPFSFPL